MRQFRILAPLLVGLLISAPADAAGPDWSEIESAFKAGEAKSGHVYSQEAASRCVGRWRLHADAVDDGNFPPEADALLPRQLRLPDAIGSADFFVVDPLDEDTSRTAADEAERFLRSAFAGDQKALRQYFENLGLCSTKPEEARDDTVVAANSPPKRLPKNILNRQKPPPRPAHSNSSNRARGYGSSAASRCMVCASVSTRLQAERYWSRNGSMRANPIRSRSITAMART